ncbi:FecR family protein [Stappia indica]|uniref:FecR family protein n=1 Tax=Stappia indica TaxID=538381 RepID=UPI0008356C16|nr:FecR domain-containing protein [Stappia indica]
MVTTFRPLAVAVAALFAMAGQPALASEPVGVASAVNQSAQSQRGGAGMRTIRIGTDFANREKIETGASGLVQILLADGSNFVVGPNSSLVIDEFVYSPSAGTGRIVATFGRGVARYVGGRISKQRGGVTINTRQGTIGVRGGMTNLVDRDGQTVFSFLYGKDLTFVGRNGKKTRVYRPGFSIVANGGQGASQRTPGSVVASVNQILSANRPSGSRPSASQIARFAAVNSSLPPKSEAQYPAPVLSSGPQGPDPRDVNHANSVYIKSNTTTYCGYYCY